MSLTDQLIQHEGLRLKPYRDSVGKLTIGVGRNLDDRGITESEALILLENDILTASYDLVAAFPFVLDMDNARYEVLVNMCFNMGITRLKGFKRMWRYLEVGNYTMAAYEMLDSRWAKQVGSRAEELAEIMEHGGNKKPRRGGAL
ncbi:MAG: glycoside hydrolase family protein [Sedimenticola sp.]